MVDIYKDTRSADFRSLFANPGAVFRGTPFWSWNNRLDKEQLVRQIEYFREMGLGGFHMHSRVGMGTEYLGTEFMDCVRACVEKAKEENLLAWLYDEDRWPSGAAGGLVTKDEQYRIRAMVVSPETAGAAAQGELLARYAVKLQEGELASYRRLGEADQAAAGEQVWQARMKISDCSSWFNNQTYLDTLNPAAVKKFIAVTHEAYRQAVGEDFGGAVPAIFTDEPFYGWLQLLDHPDQAREASFPCTGDFLKTYRAAYGEDFLATVPELIWELPAGAVSAARWRYYNHVTDRFAGAFAKQIGEWCGRHGIAFTGHMVEEPTLHSQTRSIGEAMRSLRYFQLPGIDMLCDNDEYTTCKQAQSAAHQNGRCGAMSELYGVTGWDFDFAGHKRQGDWQAALGITVRVQHLSWVSMEGEAKRDYPASIFYQSPWYQQYRVVEDHFARVNAALTRGKPLVRVGLVHPIESFWLVSGVKSQTARAQQELEDTFQNATNWLLGGQIDFDYLSEESLPELCPLPDGKTFAVGSMAYDAVVVPPVLTLRTTTVERLEAFAKAGGRVIFAGAPAALVDAKHSERVKALAARCTQTAFSRAALLDALASVRELEVRRENGEPATNLLYQMRDEGGVRYLFLCHTTKERNISNHAQDCRVRLRGEWKPEALDTATGEITALAARYEGGWTELHYTFFPQGHLLLRLTSGRAAGGAGVSYRLHEPWEKDLAARFPDRAPVTLSEPNTLLLDQAEWRIAGGEWQPREEMLRIDCRVRGALKLQKLDGGMAQPWTFARDPEVKATVELRLPLVTAVALRGAELALERPQDAVILVDGREVAATEKGWWVDESLRRVALPALDAGRHELIVRVAYQADSHLEWMYLLGDFGVRVCGRDATLVEPVRELGFGDIGGQGLPFYTGNITYHCAVDVPADAGELAVPHYAGALVEARIGGGAAQPLAYAPYRAALAGLRPGSRQTIDLTLYGHRQNAFGPLHAPEPGRWVGPGCWRTSGTNWSYGYHTVPMGILYAPVFLNKQN